MNNTPVPTDFFGTNIFDIMGNIGENLPILLHKMNLFFGGPEILLLKYILIGISIILICLIVIVLSKLTKMIRLLNDRYHPHHGHGHENTHSHEDNSHDSRVRERAMKDAWESIARHMGSSNVSDWKLAILEADSVLDELLKELGLPGDSLGERLMAATDHDIKMLQFAWDAHKARNRIAHEGIKAHLTRDDAVKILGAYERVFREFNYI